MFLAIPGEVALRAVAFASATLQVLVLIAFAVLVGSKYEMLADRVTTVLQVHEEDIKWIHHKEMLTENGQVI